MTFCEKLYGLRKNAGMTQADLAEKLNVSRQTVSRWELGTAKPEIDTLIAMCDLFDVSLDYLLRDKPLEEMKEPEEPLPLVPHYWDYLPKVWFVPALLTILCRLCPYLSEALFVMNPKAGSAVWSWVNENKLIWIFFDPPIAYMASSIFAVLTVLCFLCALFRFLKARK